MSAFSPVDETEWYDLRAFGAVEAQRRRDERLTAAEAPVKAKRRDRAKTAASARTVLASELELGMVPAGSTKAIERLCADIEPPHSVRYWLEADGSPIVLSPDQTVELA